MENDIIDGEIDTTTNLQKKMHYHYRPRARIIELTIVSDSPIRSDLVWFLKPFHDGSFLVWKLRLMLIFGKNGTETLNRENLVFL